jgi:TetR/AcrR family transcriptional regulator, repressor for neighboring sulfatase
MEEMTTTQVGRPVGKAAVMRALQTAALALLAERGIQFSIRQVAELAGVNHGLVHRHFGSKEALLTAAIADRNRTLRQQIKDNSSTLDLSGKGGPVTATILARLILDNATSLIDDHTASAAIVERAAVQVADNDPLTPEHRAALANAIVLGWTVFGDYTLRAAGASTGKEVEAALRTIVDSLLEGELISGSGERFGILEG